MPKTIKDIQEWCYLLSVNNNTKAYISFKKHKLFKKIAKKLKGHYKIKKNLK